MPQNVPLHDCGSGSHPLDLGAPLGGTFPTIVASPNKLLLNKIHSAPETGKE
jgi:hypothetical protein